MCLQPIDEYPSTAYDDLLWFGFPLGQAGHDTRSWLGDVELTLFIVHGIDETLMFMAPHHQVKHFRQVRLGNMVLDTVRSATSKGSIDDQFMESRPSSTHTDSDG